MFSFFHTEKKMKSQKKLQEEYKIFLLFSQLNSHTRHVQHGLMTTLGALDNPHFTYSLASSLGDENDFRLLVKNILMYDFDLLFTLGDMATRVAHEITLRRFSHSMPIVFAGVVDSSDTGLLHSLDSSQNFVTGTTISAHDYARHADIVEQSCPTVRNIVLLHGKEAAPQSAHDAHIFKRLLQQKGYGVKSLEISSHDDTTAVLESTVEDSTEMILTIRDSAVANSARAIAEFCNKHRIIYFASDFGSLEYGAALAYCIDETRIGIHSAELIKRVICERKDPRDIPIEHINLNTNLYVNASAHLRQAPGVSLDSLTSNVHCVLM